MIADAPPVACLQVQRAIKAGNVLVNGKVLKKPAAKLMEVRFVILSNPPTERE